MLKYSGSYANTEKNFVFLNCNTEKSIKDHKLYGLFCVVQNIIQRGVVSKPSEYLQNNLGKLNDVKEPLFLLSENVVDNWNLIKGNKEDIDYPAEVFFDILLPKYLNEYSYIKNLIIPEADFYDILGYSSVLDGQQVDFYIPQIRTVIEIDGRSHKLNKQVYKDNIRDLALHKEGIDVIRINTSDIRNETTKFKNIMNNLYEKITLNENIKKYKNINQIENNNIRLCYDAIYRIQMLLLECFKTGIFKIDSSEININFVASDIPNIDKLALFAYEDLKLWIYNIGQLLKINIIMPNLLFEYNNKKNTIYLDFSIFSRYTDTTVKYKNVIYIRNDYYCDGYFYKVATADTLQYLFPIETEIEDDKALVFLLKNLFGFTEFNAGQLPIIKNILERNDTIGILPTGGGKSLTYQICSLLQPGVTMVVVPIISLMQDQKKGMDQRHLDRTNFISSGKTGDEKSKIIDEFIDGKYQLIWISPERFQNREFRDALIKINKNLNFSLAVIDEVHCLSEWGHDFRVSYLALVNTLRNYCPEATLLGLTATASQAVLEDLKAEFENDGSGIKALTSMDRKELLFERIIVDSNEEKAIKISNIIKKNNIDYTNKNGDVKHQIGLVFCQTVNGKYNSCNSIKKMLENEKVVNRLEAYHGQMSMSDRTKVQKQFMDNAYDIMVCTKAFGMGIDKDNIKYTIHTSLPQSVESFYQEAGRAGREKDKSVKSKCYILYYPESNSLNYIIDEIFNFDTDIIKRADLSKQLRNDLSTIMFFWNSNKKTVDEEYKNISCVLERLYYGDRTLIFNKFDNDYNNSLENIQAALYKLSLLGIVENWTVEYATLDTGCVEVDYVGINEDNIYKRLLEYIHKYDIEFRIDVNSSRYKKYYEIANNSKEKVLTRYIKVLIHWANDNVLYNRLQSTYTMLQWMDPSISDKQFRMYLEEYFKFSEKTVIFEGIIYDPMNYNNWFDVLYSKDSISHQSIKPINEDMAEAILASLQRYLESYRYNTGFNYLCGILRIFVGKFSGTEGEWRFKEAINNIKESFGEEERNIILNKTLEIGSIMRIDCKDQLSMELLKYYGGLEEEFFAKLKDRYSLSVILEKPTKIIEKIVKENL